MLEDHSLLEKCTTQTKCAAPRTAQKLARRRRRGREGREEVLRAHALGMAPVPGQGQCTAAVCVIHTMPVTQWLNQMRNVLVPSPRKVHWGDARRAQPVPFPQCQQLRVGVDVWWVTDLRLSHLREKSSSTHAVLPAS